ncbi:three prime repair exonuclease 2 [Tachyglossus aculeatus]|uniref:three prime repair exonuclease 2 n=1 Tax=Tachyglossus aculeatus TaxID=9261 RepID=UPI0018F7848B|nr:three prime repair exonuclease 2 [Tachyglossus aculeatus]
MSESQKCETFVFLDLEATGLPDAYPQIAEISLFAIHRVSLEHPVWDESGDLLLPRVLDKLTLCMNPEQPFTPKAAKITGLNNQNLTDNQKPCFDGTVVKILREFLSRQVSPICLVAHNGFAYDFPLLRTELQRLGANLLEDTYCLDTLPALKGLDKAHDHGTRSRRGKSYRLGNLYRQYFGDDPKAAHSAEGDVYTLVMVFLHRAPELLQWAGTKARSWDEIEPMYSPGPRRSSGRSRNA